MDTQHSPRHSSPNLNEISCVSDYTLGLFKQPRLNSWINQWLREVKVWLEKAHLTPQLPQSSWGAVIRFVSELKILLAHSALWWLLSLRPTLNKRALGGGRINICNGKSRTKGQILLCTQCSFCNRTGWLWGRRCRNEVTLTLSAGSLWWSSEHSLPLCKDTNAQQLHPKEDCSEFLSRQQSMEELLGKVVNFNLARIRMLT